MLKLAIYRYVNYHSNDLCSISTHNHTLRAQADSRRRHSTRFHYVSENQGSEITYVQAAARQTVLMVDAISALSVAVAKSIVNKQT